jgi:hypothetical protein
LFDLLQSPCATAEVIRDSLRGVPAEGLNLLCRGVLRSTLDATDKREVLQRLARRRDFDAVSLMADARPEVTAYGPLLQAIVCEPLRRALDRIHEQPARFAETEAALEAAQPLLDGVSASRAKAWGDLKRTLEEYQREQAEQDSALKLALLGGRKWDFAEDICRCLDRCFPLEQQDAFRRQQYRPTTSRSTSWLIFVGTYARPGP